MRVKDRNSLAAVIALAIGLTGAVAAAGCQPRSSGSSGGTAASEAPAPGFGMLEVRVTDAPFAANCFSEATLTIENFEIQSADQLGDIGFVPVTRTATFNLMDLTGGKTETIAQLVMPTGGYDRLRFNITAAVLSWYDGTQRNFVIPPDIRPIVRTGTVRIEPGLTTVVTLD